MNNIKFAKNNIKKNDILKINKILKSGWLTHGKFTHDFEENFKKFTRSKFSLLVSNCTAGLYLACNALNFKKGDEIIVTSQTHVATAHAVSFTGAKPVFADISLYDGNIDVDDIKKLINKKTKGIIVVHFAGYPCEMNKIMKISKKYKLKVIEDCAHALGTTINGIHVGNFGDVGVFSFYPTKQITTGEGGMLICNNKRIFNSLKINRAFGIDTDIHKRKIPGLYDVKSLALNFRATDFQACMGLEQLKRYKNELLIRKKNANYYHNKLRNIDLVKSHKFKKNASYFIYPIFVSKNLRKKVIENFKKNKIGFSIHYAKSLNVMSYYNKGKRLKNSEIFSEETISLPVHSDINKKKIDFIISKIKEVF